MNDICIICGTKVHAKQMCQKHYRRALAASRGVIVSNVRDLSLQDLITTNSYPDPKTTCWEWLKSCYPSGYGQLQTTKSNETLAHRISYVAFIGEIPTNLYVCHSCDNRKCVNPEHLFLGSALDNAVDRNTKNRQAKGTVFNRSKLTDADIIYIRTSSLPQKQLATKYQVSTNLISQIKLYKKWKHIS